MLGQGLVIRRYRQVLDQIVEFTNIARKRMRSQTGETGRGYA